MRLTTTLSDLFDKAIAQGSQLVQCFFITQKNTYLSLSSGEIELLREKRKKFFTYAYLHTSYWVNLAGARRNGWRTFMREIDLAWKIGFSHVVIHPGSGTGCATKDEAIECLARALNKAVDRYPEIMILIENTAHGKMSVGGDLKDFQKLLVLIEQPDRIGFCIDSAHAYSYGYDIRTFEGLCAFMQELEITIGMNRVKLLHLNDAQDACGSKLDRHAAPGSGLIGTEALKKFMNYPGLEKVPVIIEIPTMTDSQEQEVLTLVKSWSQESAYIK